MAWGRRKRKVCVGFARKGGVVTERGVGAERWDSAVRLTGL